MKKSKFILIVSLLALWSFLIFGFGFVPQVHKAISTIMIAVWDKDKPSASTSLRASNPLMLANFAALEDAIGQDHEFSTGGTNSGKHIQVTFDDFLSAAPSSVDANEGVLYLLEVGSTSELHFEDEDENTLQITSGGNLYSSTNLTVVGTSTFTGAVTANGGITLGAGDDLIGSSTSDITFNTDKFTVAGATGNTVIAGTLTVTGAATIGDSSQMATSAAPTEDADLANKKYVDDLIASDVTMSAYTNLDSDDSAMLKAHAYLAQTAGFVVAQADIGAAGRAMRGYVGATSDPAGAGTLVAIIEHAGEKTITFPVAEGEYFEITLTTDTPTIYWKSLGTLVKPADQD